MTVNLALGIDIGGTGMKAGIVDLGIGELVTERERIPTPQPATPAAMTGVLERLVDHFEWTGPIGTAFPAIVKRGVVHSAANVDHSWLGVDAAALFSESVGQPVRMLNDADAAGLAEIGYGAGVDRDGVVLVLTVGTGIGSALFVDGVLVPNTELGHLQLDGHTDVEDWAAASARDRESLGWRDWAPRLDRYLEHVCFLFSPDLVILGGGASKRFEKFADLLRPHTEIVAATLRNRAGIVGAAMAAVG
ncbi:MAG: ROK family protein [Acidimicrobiia bacterium]|nr:ROK family protein [Acidimicrobiia bacterium]